MKSSKKIGILAFGMLTSVVAPQVLDDNSIVNEILANKTFNNAKSHNDDINIKEQIAVANETQSPDYVFLSDIKHKSVKVGWRELCLDKDLSGNKITLLVNGSYVTFDKGLFAHATSEVVYDLTNYSDYAYFTTYYGVNKTSGNSGDGVKFYIYTSTDGQNWTLKTEENPDSLMSSHEAKHVKIDIKGAKYLKLYANANSHNGNDHSVWADAKLIKEGYSDEVTDSVETYDEKIRNLYKPGKEMNEELEKLVLQRHLVDKIGSYQLKQIFADESSKRAFDWVFNDLDTLRLYVMGGAPDGTYRNSFKVLGELYDAYKDDLNAEGTSPNFNVPLKVIYKKMIITLSLTHSQTVSFWIQSSNGEPYTKNPNISVATDRYAVYKKMLSNHKLNSIFEQLEVEEMRLIMNSFINDDEIEWLRDYIISSGKQWRSAYQFMNYKNVNTGLYRDPKFYGENRANWAEKYKLSGYDMANIKYFPKVFMIMEIGGVCWQISNVGQNMVASYGVPSVMLGQPGHVMYTAYELDDNGNGWWSNWNDVGGWSTINANSAYSGHKSYFAVRLINGWGKGSFVTGNMSGNYLFLGQAAMNDYDNYVKSQEKVLLANSFTDKETKEKIYKEALEIQDINLDAWLGLINTYIADDTKNDEEFYALAEAVAKGLRLHPLPMYDLLNLINRNIDHIAYQTKVTALQTKTLQEATKATSNDSSQYGAIRVVANALLGKVESEVAKFSFDGENAGVLALSKKYEHSNALWDYSLDGGETWTTVTEKSVKLTSEEIANITEEKDILVHIIGVNYSKENIYTIDIKNSNLPQNLYANDLENRVIAASDNMEWRIDPKDNWTSFKDQKPDLTGNKTVEVRVGATGTYMPSASNSFSFTADKEDPKKTYVSIDHLSISSKSSENVRPNKNEYEYASNTIDGNINTWWHTSRVSTTDQKFIVIKLDEPRYISAIEYIPKQNYYYGIPKDIKVSVSSDGENWVEVGSATFEKSFTPKTIDFTKKMPAEYVKLQASTSYEPGNGQNNYFMNAAMINLFEDKTSTMPTVEVEYSITTSTAKPVVAKIINPSTNIHITNNNGSDTYTFNENGVFTFTFEDDDHNQGYYEAKVDWIKDYDFSLDGPDAGKIIISSKYKSDNLKWEYSIDGGTTWLNATNLEHQLTDSEIASLTSQNDIKIHITTSNDLTDINHTIDLTDSTALDQTIFSNDLENKIFGITDDIEWRIVGTNKWTSYAESKPDLTGNKSVEIRRKGKGTTLCSGIKSFEFTDAYEGNKKKEYISIDRLSIADVSSETVRPERGDYEYATNAIDGNDATKWHSSRTATNDEKYIVIKMNAPAHVSMLQWVPEKGYTHGKIKDAIVYSSMDGITWKEVGRVENNPDSDRILDIELDSTEASKYIKVQAPVTYPVVSANKGYFLSAASINLFEDKTEGIPQYVEIEYSTTGTTRDPVTATVVSNKKIKITNNEESNQYTFTKNGKFVFEYVDEKGVTGSIEAHVDWIDESIPVIEVKYSTKEKTNKDVIASIELPEGYKMVDDTLTTHTFTENGEHTFEYINEEGHSGYTIASVTWIKKDIEQLEVKYNITSKTNKNVIATLELPEGYKIANNGSNTYTFTKNGSYTFYYRDEYGNTATAEANVDWIQKDLAELHVTYDITTETSSNVTATLILAEGITIRNNNGQNTYVFTENGEFTFEYVDEYGNIGYATARVDWIKKEIPNLKVVYNITGKTNKDVTATLELKEGIKIVNDGPSTHTFTENGTYIFKYVDAYGNIGESVATVDWIDKVAPKGTIVYGTTHKTNQDVIVKLETDEKVTIKNNDSIYYTFTENGTFTFEFVDEAGNVGTATATVSWIDRELDPVEITYDKTTLTNQDVTATLKLDEGFQLLNSDGKLTHTFTENGVYEFAYRDAHGNEGVAVAVVTWIDKVAPTATLEYDIPDKTNKNVTVTLTPSEEITITNNGGKNTYTFTENGTFTFEFVDAAGNTGTATATVDWIRKNVDNLKVIYNTHSKTNQNVTATLELIDGIKITNNNGSNHYTFTENGTFNFEYTDAYGNVGMATATVDWIDKTAPTATLQYNIPSKTNKNVTVTLKPSEKITITNNGGKDTYTFTENGEFTFIFVDEAGNTGSITAKVDWIDKVAPTAALEYDITSKTNKNVTVTLKPSEEITITNNGGKNTYTFTENGTFTFEFVDEAGNTGTITATVDWINKNIDDLQITYSNKNKTNKDVVATLELKEGIRVTNNNGSNTYTFTANGTFTFEYIDAFGNIGMVTAKVDWINKEKPTAELVYNIRDLTNKDVVVSLVNPSKNITITNNNGKDTYTFTENGTFTFEFVDEYGNIGTATATVNWIDKVAPTATLEYDIPDKTNKNVTVTLKPSEEITITNNGGKNTYTFTANGTFTFEFVDKAGNTGSITATVDWINKNIDDLQITYNIDKKTNKDVTATLELKEGIKVTNNGGKNTYTFTQNGTFTFEYIDAYGNTGKVTAIVNWINKETPKLDVSYNIKTPTDKNVIATLELKEGIRITNNGGKNTYTFTENGTFTFEYVDEYGNIGKTEAKVTWIDSEKLQVTIEYSTKQITSSSVIATIKSNKNITITNNGGKDTYTFTENGTFTFEYVDAYGNTGSITATVNWINKQVPTADIEYSTKKLTNQDVTVKLVNPSTDIRILNNNGKDTYTFTENGTFTFEIMDAYGNIGHVVATVDWIDKVAPTATIEYSTTENTKGPVIVTLKPNEEVTITNNGGKASYIFTENGTFTFEFVDKAGNKGSVTAVVNCIITDAPVLNITYDRDTLTNKDVTATLELKEGIRVTNNGGSNKYTFTENGTFTFEYVDALGNKGTMVATVDWIDKVAPTATIKYDITNKTNKDVTASLVGSSEKIHIINAKNGIYIFTENGEYIFEFEDEAGNIGKAVAKVDWIDKIAPTATIEYSETENTDGPVIVTLKPSEKVTILNNGGKASYIFLENSEFTFEFVDEAGNKGKATAKVTWINKKPDVEVIYDNQEPTPNGVTVTIVLPYGYQICNNGGKNTYTFTENGSFTFKYIDANGNEGSKTINVDWIYEEKPSLDISYNTTLPTDKAVVATVTLKPGVTITNNGGSNTYTFTKNGSFTFEYIDKYGNVGTITAKVSWIKSNAENPTPSNTVVSGNNNGSSNNTLPDDNNSDYDDNKQNDDNKEENKKDETDNKEPNSDDELDHDTTIEDDEENKDSKLKRLITIFSIALIIAFGILFNIRKPKEETEDEK